MNSEALNKIKYLNAETKEVSGMAEYRDWGRLSKLTSTNIAFSRESCSGVHKPHACGTGNKKELSSTFKEL